MTESFLHYVWQFQYFNKRELTTSAGDSISVFRAGFYNTNAGPDFAQAKIKIGSIEWVGSVEVHIKSSEWTEHGHHRDAAYENVVLHVVWQDDKPVVRKDGTVLPTLELRGRVEDALLNDYRKLVSSASTIACSTRIATVSSFTRNAMVDKVVVARLQAKSIFVLEHLKLNNHDWEETTYQVLAKNFGFKVNAEPFLRLARNMPCRILMKHADNLLQVECLLFGVAGFLEGGMNDEHFARLQKEFKILSSKYSLEGQKLNPAEWKFLRLRPANFPTIRIAQFASLLTGTKSIFSRIVEAESYDELKEIFTCRQSEYWTTHFRFGKKSSGNYHAMGVSSIENIVINTVAPLLVAFGHSKGNQSLIDRVCEILQQMPPEENRITRLWSELDWRVTSAFDSQGLIELYNNYCHQRNCLNCNIGVALLKPKIPE